MFRPESIALLGACTLIAACASMPPDPGTSERTSYERAISIMTDPHGFEIPPVLTPEEALPPSLVRGKYHRLIGDVRTDGFTNTYTVESDFGTVEVHGTGLLRKYVHEIEVIGELRDYEVSEAQIYGLASANAAEDYAEGAAQLIVHPAETIIAIPKGMWSYVARIVAMSKGQRGQYEDDYAEELMGFSQSKREWAYRLGVDVYSSNPLLQQTLNRYAWASFAGGMSIRITSLFVTGGASVGLSVTGAASDMRRELRDKAPEELRKRNYDKLIAMGISEEETTGFLSHPWYSPSRQVLIVDALESMSSARNRESFVQVARGADEEADAFFFTRLALMLYVCNSTQGPIEELLAPNGLVMGYTATKEIVVPLVLDFGVRSRPLAVFGEAVNRSMPSDREIAAKHLWITGMVSPKLKQELVDGGWIITDRFEERLTAELNLESPDGNGTDPNRILPEIGR